MTKDSDEHQYLMAEGSPVTPDGADDIIWITQEALDNIREK